MARHVCICTILYMHVNYGLTPLTNIHNDITVYLCIDYQAVVGVPSQVYPAVSACSALLAPLQMYCFKTNRPVLRVLKLTSRQGTPMRVHKRPPEQQYTVHAVSYNNSSDNITVIAVITVITVQYNNSLLLGGCYTVQRELLRLPASIFKQYTCIL